MWLRKAPALAATGRLGEGDLEAFATYCTTFDEELSIRAVLKKDGEYQQLPSGRMVKHPALDDLMRWLELRRKYEVEFGFTPASRAGVKGSGPQKPVVETRKR